MTHVTEILNAAQAGDKQAAAQLLPLVYGELRKLASSKLAKELVPQSINATALVHEAYLRLVGSGDSEKWDGRGHFFSAAAEAMRRILVEAARRRQSQKHGKGVIDIDLDQVLDEIQLKQPPEEIVAISEALERLVEVDPRAAELVKLRYFAGFTIPESAEILGVSPRTADSLWSYARAWLSVEIRRNL